MVYFWPDFIKTFVTRKLSLHSISCHAGFSSQMVSCWDHTTREMFIEPFDYQPLKKIDLWLKQSDETLLKVALGSQILNVYIWSLFTLPQTSLKCVMLIISPDSKNICVMDIAV